MDKKFYVTTPIYYPSGKPHLGTCYSTIAADVIARYRRLQGYDVMFTTGTDEHGQKIEVNAAKNKKSPQVYVNEIAENFKSLWKVLGISYDKFVRTTDESHQKIVQKIFKKLYDIGKIYKGTYKGWYCTPCETFFTDSQLCSGRCPDCRREVTWAEEEAYFFKLSEYSDKLLEYYEQHPGFIEPEGRKNEMVQFIKSGLDDLCVSRTSFKWGIPVDFDDSHIVYVWLDALTNYIISQGYMSENDENFKKYWPADIHLIGKEILRFHVIIWPAILMALELPLPRKVFAHGWILFGDGSKMSKSKGNIVEPLDLCQRYGVDALRYFLMREFSFSSDGIFTNEALINRINFDLANDLGNLLSRTVSMTQRYFGGTIPENHKESVFDGELINFAKKLRNNYESKMNSYKFSSALSEVWLLISKCNKYIDETMPWKLGKDENQRERLAAVIYNLCECIRIISVLILPFMPETSKKIQDQIGAKSDICTWDSAGKWGMLPKKSTTVKGEAIFPRIDIKKETEEAIDASGKNSQYTASKIANIKLENDKKNASVKSENIVNLIDIDDFANVKLIVVKIKECEPVKKSKKLLKLTVDDGEGDRIVVSGISLYYKPEKLIGKSVILVSNLKPAKLCGVESNGMILAATCPENKVKVIFADNEIPAGSPIS